MNKEYVAAVAKIRALENRLINLNKLSRMVEATDVPSALRELQDTDYAESLALVREEENFEIIITHQLEQTYKLVLEISEYSELVKCFLFLKDFHNLKVAFKEKYGNVEGSLYYLKPSSIEIEKLKKIVSEGNYLQLPFPFREIARKIEDIFGQTQHPQDIDLVVDKKTFEYALNVSKENKNKFVENIFIYQIDLNNIRTFIRVKLLAKDKQYFKKLFLEGGRIEMDKFMEIFEGSFDDLTKIVEFKDYYSVVSEGIEYYKKYGDFSFLEKKFDDFIIKYVKPQKMVTFGIEPLIAYLIAKETEAKNIRNVIIGKFNLLPAKVVHSRLRELYV